MTQSELEKRLHALSTEDGDWEDWSELLRRGERERARTTRRRALVVAIALVVLALPTIAIAFGRGDFLAISLTDEDVPPPVSETKLGYSIGDELRLPGRPPAKLADSVLAPFLGKEAALVIPSPDGRRIAYHAWEEAAGEPEGGTPLLRVFDTETGHDAVLERGAQSLAWDGDGRLAYVKALVPEYRNSPEGTTGGRIGHIVVRRSLDEPPRRWTRLATEYVVHAWAARRLIVSVRVSNVFRGRQPAGGVYSFSGPHRSRRLPVADVLAISPDGRFLLGAAGPQDDFEERSRVRVVDVADGRVAAQLDLRRADRPEFAPGLRSGLTPGSWVADTIILEGGVGEASALLVLGYRAGRLVLEQVLKLTREVAEATGLRGPILFHFGQPVFVDSAAREFMAELTLLQTGDRGTSLWLTCDRIARSCRRGRAIEPPTRWAALVYNPSRPLPD
jgi:hypothetical protein